MGLEGTDKQLNEDIRRYCEPYRCDICGKSITHEESWNNEDQCDECWEETQNKLKADNWVESRCEDEN